MKRAEEIARDVKREMIREAIRRIVHVGGQPTVGRIARDARLPEATVASLLPTFSPDAIVDLVEDVEPERELAAVA